MKLLVGREIVKRRRKERRRGKKKIRKEWTGGEIQTGQLSKLYRKIRPFDINNRRSASSKMSVAHRLTLVRLCILGRPRAIASLALGVRPKCRLFYFHISPSFQSFSVLFLRLFICVEAGEKRERFVAKQHYSVRPDSNPLQIDLRRKKCRCRHHLWTGRFCRLSLSFDRHSIDSVGYSSMK